MTVLTVTIPGYAAQEAVDHGEWDRLLRRYVTNGLVDYEALRQEREALDAYVERLSQVPAAALPSREAQLAFWINAYNALVVHTVLDRGAVESVKAIDGFFDRLKHPIAGESLTLNAIEDRARALGDWRVHMALVCASLSCPPLRSETYVPERIDQQLDEQANRFLNDSARGFRVEDRTMWVSKIFKWYAKDFVPRGSLTTESLWAVIGRYVSQEESLFRDPSTLTLRFLDYDWSLNARRP